MPLSMIGLINFYYFRNCTNFITKTILNNIL